MSFDPIQSLTEFSLKFDLFATSTHRKTKQVAKEGTFTEMVL